MENILSYIRSLLPTTAFGRKRRAADDCESPLKIRRTSYSQLSSPEEDWYSTVSSPSMKKRSNLLPKPEKSQWSLKDLSPIVIDEDDDVVTTKESSFALPRRSFSYKQATSTPNCTATGLQNGAADDDVIFINAKLSSTNKSSLANRKGFDYIKPNVLCLNNNEGSGPERKVSIQNGTIKRRSTPFFNSLQNSKSKLLPEPRKPIQTTALEYSYRLDEKKQYEEMLGRNVAAKSPLNNYNDFKKFHLRGKRIVDLALKSTKKAPDFIDLTNDNNKTKKQSTLETIQKVLKEHDNESVLKNNQTDIEILPSPPSPKPDFQIEKHNSLASFKHPSDPTHENWIQNEIKKHDEAFQKRQRAIELQTRSLAQFSRISDEIRENLLTQKVNTCLNIKNVLIPVEEPVENAFKELTQHQNALVDNAFNRQRPATEVLVSKFNMNITRADMGTLHGLSWLNDEVINFYMNLIIERGKSKSFPAAYAMNTFFYPKISTGGQSSVRRWTRKVDIFSYDMIAVPIHLGMHWCMAMIDFRTKTINYYDSMGSPNKSCLTTLLQYLRDEHNDKKKTDIDLSDWRLINARDIPQQMNGSDCGMFSITFAEFLTRDAKISFAQENMPYLRRKVAVEILEGKLFIS
ncbi:uncharacterized protein [Onthophagus taurus]|uniref:uncharacterized protein n=1 Tax=Onthophagus taurus TaxID=166361 RepID=UPI000C203EB7|nr:ubiquitin-like-specific protease ESD4 [Onthophagus taurus]